MAASEAVAVDGPPACVCHVEEETEPLDPAIDNSIHSTRGDTPLAPQGHYASLPDRFTWDTGSYIKTWSQARRAQYRHLCNEVDGARRQGWTRTPRQQYGRVVNTDRICQRDYDDLHTVLLSLRIRPVRSGQWLPPVTMMNAVYQALRSRAMDRLRRQLSGKEWEYVAVIAGTEHFATPHYHLYTWVDGEVKPQDFGGVVDAFVEDCEFAPDDGTGNRIEDGAVTVEGPATRTLATDNAVRRDLNEERGAPTAGAVYVASQIPNMAQADQATDAQLEHGAVADAIEHTAVSFSHGCWTPADGEVTIDNSICSPRADSFPSETDADTPPASTGPSVTPMPTVAREPPVSRESHPTAEKAVSLSSMPKLPRGPATLSHLTRTMQLDNDTETEQLSIDQQTFDDLYPTDDTLLRFNRRYVGEYIGHRSILQDDNIWYFAGVPGSCIVVVQRDSDLFVRVSFEDNTPLVDYSATSIPLESLERLRR